MRFLSLLLLLALAACTSEPAELPPGPVDEDTLASEPPEPEPLPLEPGDASTAEALLAQFQTALASENRQGLLALLRFPIGTPNGEMDRDQFNSEFEGVFMDEAFRVPLLELAPADLAPAPAGGQQVEVVEFLPDDSEFEPGTLTVRIDSTEAGFRVVGFDLAG